MKCNLCTTKKVFSKKGLAIHKARMHKEVNETAGAPADVPGKPTSEKPANEQSPIRHESSSNSTSIDNHHSELKEFKDFLTALVNSLASNFEEEINTIKQQISTINITNIPLNNPPNPIISESPPCPLSIATPFIQPKQTVKTKVAEMTPTAISNRFSPLRIEALPPGEFQQPAASWAQTTPPSIPQTQSMPTNNPPAQRPFVNNFPENDMLIKIVPGLRKYSDTVRDADIQPNNHNSQQIVHHSSQRDHHNSQRRDHHNSQQVRHSSQERRQQTRQPERQHQYQRYRLLILGDSNIHKINPRDLSRELNSSVYVDKHAYSGATAAHLRHYSDIGLNKKPNGVVIHGGTNDLLGSNSSDDHSDDIACTLIETAVKARSLGTKDIFISSVLPTKDEHANTRAAEINSFLKSYCKAYGFCFVDNRNITIDDLKKDDDRDRVHLSDVGGKQLMYNFAHYFNQ